jgi:hypothetical protein
MPKRVYSLPLQYTKGADAGVCNPKGDPGPYPPRCFGLFAARSTPWTPNLELLFL